MNRAQIVAIQKKIGTEPDGFWGPKSIAACQKHLRALMPKPNPWPSSDEASLQRFYGSAGDEDQHVQLNVAGLGVAYEGKPVKTIRCHKKVADSLGRVLKEVSKTNPEVLAEYAGVYNPRPMRGGKRWSLHARAAAIDLDPDTNGNNMSWPNGSTMPFEVIEAFSREGWLSAGAWWSRDSMHFQGTK